MTLLALSIGSNIDAANNLRSVVQELRSEFGNAFCSRVFESEAVGFEGDNFLNLVVLAETNTELSIIISYLKQLEEKLGRDRSQEKFSARPIDVDILIYGDESGASCGIDLPRPEITENAFVLWPLSEALPDQKHSLTGALYSELWKDYDKSAQRLWPIDFDWG